MAQKYKLPGRISMETTGNFFFICKMRVFVCKVMEDKTGLVAGTNFLHIDSACWGCQAGLSSYK